MIKTLDMFHVKCEKCSTMLSYEHDDVYNDGKCNYYIKCPNCGERVICPNYFEDTTVDNISFPKSFFRFGGSESQSITDSEITKWCKECVKVLERNNKEYGVFNYKATGNAKVIVIKFSDEYEITVAKDYYEASIPR